MDLFKWFRKRPAPAPVAWDKAPSEIFGSLTAWERHELERNRCPDCGTAELLGGPRGGMMQNIKCASQTCGSMFNVGRIDSGIIGERISPPSPKKDEGHEQQTVGT